MSDMLASPSSLRFRNPQGWGYPTGLDAEITRQLAEQGISIVAYGQDGSVYVEYNYSEWKMTDNGGELNVVRVNDDKPFRSIALTSTRHPMPATVEEYATVVVVRILAVLHGKPVDYQWRPTHRHIQEKCNGREPR